MKEEISLQEFEFKKASKSKILKNYLTNSKNGFFILIIIFSSFTTLTFLILSHESFLIQKYPDYSLFYLFIMSLVILIFNSSELRFILNFHNVEKTFYNWKYEKSLVGRANKFFLFQREFDSFWRKLQKNASGFNYVGFTYVTLFNSNAFDIRTNRVKKEIDICFLLLTEMFYKNDLEIEYFLNEFKNTFMNNVNALNLITVRTFFIQINNEFKKHHPEEFTVVQAEINEYYRNTKKLRFISNERKFELLKLIVGNFFGTIVAITVAYFVTKFILV